jgi:hypothetical protein
VENFRDAKIDDIETNAVASPAGSEIAMRKKTASARKMLATVHDF